jgi:acetyl esterase
MLERKLLALYTLKYLLFLSSIFATAAESKKSEIENLQVGSEFTYGHHQLKWRVDNNANGLMDRDEVDIKKKAEWQGINDAEFKQIIIRRRDQLYFKNAYVYKKTPTRDLELYVDFPKDWKASDQRPAIVWFFGGAWNTGTPFAFKPQSDYFARRGLVSICVDYRIRTVDGIHTDGFISGWDAKTAIRWVRKNASSLGINPNKIIAGGGSAGGHLAIATQIPKLNDPADDLAISTKVSALILHNPYVVYINPKSWIYQIDFKTLPPVWVGYGLKDKAAYNDDSSTKRTERNGESFVKELGQAGVPLRTYIKEDGGHGFCSSPLYLETSTLDIADFLQECGLLDKGAVPGPGKKTSGAWANQHRRQILQGQAKLSQPKVLEFVNK